MANNVTGGVTLSCSFVQQLDAGATRINAYPVPVQPSRSVSYSTGAGAYQVQALAQGSGTTASSTPVDLDLMAITRVDGVAGFTHVREAIVFNDSAADVLTVGDDGVVTNAWTAWSETGAQFKVQPGACLRIAKPAGANGYDVDGTHKVLRLDPGAAAVPYRFVVAGD